MTRFARAKGSKSSNERVPDEATPWNVMKMQLEESQTSSKEIPKKAKTAKQLLAEKDELFYHDTTGNVNHEWAAFDEVPESKSGKDKGGKLGKSKSSKKDKKKLETAAKLHLTNDHSNNDQIVQVVEKAKNNKQNESQASEELETPKTIDRIKTKNKKRKKTIANDTMTQIVEVVEKAENKKQNESQASEELETPKTIDRIKTKNKKRKKTIANDTMNSELDAEKLLEPNNADEDKANSPSINLNSKDTLTDDKSDSKSRKRAKRSKKSRSGMDSGDMGSQLENVTSEAQRNKKQELTNADSDKKESPSNVEGNTEKLSKRQKRNQKKQRRILSEKNESKIDVGENASQKEQTPKGFDVSGNDWSNEVKFGKQINPRQLSETVTTDGNNEVDKSKDLDNKKEKLNKKKTNLEKESEGDEAQNDNSIPDNLKNQKDNNTKSKKSQKRKGGKNDNKEYKRRKPDEGVIKMIFNGIEVEVVKYDGFPVKKEDAERLQELKKNMIIKGIPRSEINIAMKLERRKAEKALTRERKRVCFHCRKSGHNLSDCPELGRDESGTGICFKCGSAEHTHFECKVVKGQEFRHASCFICREQGHIARQCPDNPKGLYPQGGGCKICGDVTHLKKDCPDLIKEKEETNITADKIVGSQLESLEEDQTETKNENEDKKPRSKIIKF